MAYGIFTLVCWAILLAAGRVIGGEEHGPTLGLAMIGVWQFSMLVIATWSVKQAEL